MDARSGVDAALRAPCPPAPPRRHVALDRRRRRARAVNARSALVLQLQFVARRPGPRPSLSPPRTGRPDRARRVRRAPKRAARRHGRADRSRARGATLPDARRTRSPTEGRLRASRRPRLVATPALAACDQAARLRRPMHPALSIFPAEPRDRSKCNCSTRTKPRARRGGGGGVGALSSGLADGYLVLQLHLLRSRGSAGNGE